MRDKIIEVSNFNSIFSTRPVSLNGKYPADGSTVIVAPNGTYPSYASGQPGLSVSIALSFVSGSNSHVHSDGSNDPKIVGVINPASFVLGDNYPQNVPIVFTATNFCGLIHGHATFSSGETKDNWFNVVFGGLGQLPPHPSLSPYTHDKTHPQNTNGTPNLIAALQALGDAYGKKFFGPGYTLWVNDMSLPNGGIFCSHPHGHKWGNEVDISYNLMTQPERDWFEANALQFFKWFEKHDMGTGFHYHCSVVPRHKDSEC